MGWSTPAFAAAVSCTRPARPHRSDGQVIYAGTCRGLTPAEIAERSKTRAPAWRVQVPDEVTAFEDGHMGHYEENLARDCGDFFSCGGPTVCLPTSWPSLWTTR